MSVVSIQVRRPQTYVWDGIIDAERYPQWLAGAQDVRAPAQWPRPGTAFEHRIGLGPLRVPGSTTAETVDEPSRFSLRAGMGLLGEAAVTFQLESRGPTLTEVVMSERPSGGPVRLLGSVARPVIDRLITLRNRASLERFRDMLEADGT